MGDGEGLVVSLLAGPITLLVTCAIVILVQDDGGHPDWWNGLACGMVVAIILLASFELLYRGVLPLAFGRS